MRSFNAGELRRETGKAGAEAGDGVIGTIWAWRQSLLLETQLRF